MGPIKHACANTLEMIQFFLGHAQDATALNSLRDAQKTVVKEGWFDNAAAAIFTHALVEDSLDAAALPDEEEETKAEEKAQKAKEELRHEFEEEKEKLKRRCGSCFMRPE